MSIKKKGKLTDLELEIMNVIWELGETTIPEVNRVFKDRKINQAYTTTATMMKILEKKKFLKSIKKERVHKFIPKVEKTIYEENIVNHIIDNVFQGESAKLVMKLLDESELNLNELEKIKEVLESRMINE